MLRAILPLLVPVLAMALGGLLPLPRMIMTDSDGAVSCRAATAADVACAAACGGCPVAGSETASDPNDCGEDVGVDCVSCVVCVCGIGVPESSPELVTPGECFILDARPVSLLTSVDREPTSPPPKRTPLVS